MKNKKVLITGSQGFVGTYLCNEMLNNKYDVIGVDSFVKYGKVIRPHDEHPNFTLYENDVLSEEFKNIVRKEKPDFIISNAHSIGGISYFHSKSYDLLATNERINAQVFDMAIEGYKEGYIKRIIGISSSMVFENTKTYPTPESDVIIAPPPSSTYGFSKLAVEYFCKGAYEQYGLPYTIVRPFNCVGAFENDALAENEIMSGNIKLMLSHCLPDIINKIIKNQNPLHILGDGNQLRAYTNGADLARGVRIAMESEKAINNDFNISVSEGTTVIELAEKVWKKLKPNEPFNYVSDKPFTYDVQKRLPDTTKAKEILGFEAKIMLDQSIDEVIAYMTKNEHSLKIN